MGIKDKVRVGSQPHIKLLLVLCPPLRQEEKLASLFVVPGMCHLDHGVPDSLINWILYLLYNI